MTTLDEWLKHRPGDRDRIDRIKADMDSEVNPEVTDDD